MAVQKTGSGSVVERAVQWAKEVGEKIKTAVAEYTGASGYDKADKPAVKPQDAAVNNAHAAGKFAVSPEDYLEIPRGRVLLDRRNAYIQDMQDMRKRPLSDDEIRAILQEALKPRNLKSPQIEDIRRELDRLNQTR